MKKYLIPEISLIILKKEADIIICSNMTEETQRENGFDNIINDNF